MLNLIRIPFLSLMLLLVGCESLPTLSKIEEIRASRRANAAQVVAKDGTFMVQQRAAIEEELASVDGESLLVRQGKILEVLNGAPATPGNNSRILIDGPQTWQAIWGALESAKHHIHIESFIFEELDFDTRLSDLLIARKKAGVDIRILYDSVGSNATPATFFKRQANKESPFANSIQSICSVDVS